MKHILTSVVVVALVATAGSLHATLIGLDQITDGTSNTIILGETPECPTGDSGAPQGGFGQITDGTSNTIVLGEITDGTSNTILIGEGSAGQIPCGCPTQGAVGGGITDGTSNTIILGETPACPVPDGGATSAALLAGSLVLLAAWRVRGLG